MKHNNFRAFIAFNLALCLILTFTINNNCFATVANDNNTSVTTGTTSADADEATTEEEPEEEDGIEAQDNQDEEPPEETVASEDPVYKVPATPSGFTQTDATTTSISLSWNKVSGATGYQICYYSSSSKKWYYYGGPSNNSITSTTYNLKSKKENNKTVISIKAGKTYRFYIRSYMIHGTDSDGNNIVTYSPKSSAIKCYTTPKGVGGVKLSSYTSNTITFAWNAVSGATGYVVRRKKSGDSSYTTITTTRNTSYKDGSNKKLSSGTTYTYQVAAYNGNDKYRGSYSSALKLSTCPANPVTTIKGGDEKLRLKWKKVTGASGYKVYLKKGSSYDLLKNCSKSTTSYLLKDLSNGTQYSMRVIAYRTLNKGKKAEATYSASGVTRAISPAPLGKASTTAKYYTNKKKFQASKAYKKLKWFKKYVDYDKSYVMPGVKSTNVAGFKSTHMCPQAITFAKDYLLMTAYDYVGEERSVIYVMDKKNKKLLTTLVLPDQVHLGGIAFDGENVWVSHGEKIGLIKFGTIESAAKAGKSYKEISYKTLLSVKTTASFMTYYKDMLWIGKNAEKGTQIMYSYAINDKAGTPSITPKSSVRIPNRVQGVAFTDNGELVLSRSNLYLSSMPYYIARLEYYKPTWKNNKITKLNKAKNTMPMPTMNEGIEIHDDMLYVVYESPAFSSTTYQMDRICAFKAKGISKKVK